MNEKLTAYALYEMSPDERAAFEAQLQSDPALRQQAEEWKTFCELLEKELPAGADATLQPEQRTQLIQTFQQPRNVIRPFWRRPAVISSVGFAAAACVVLMIALREEPPSANLSYEGGKKQNTAPVDFVAAGGKSPTRDTKKLEIAEEDSAKDTNAKSVSAFHTAPSIPAATTAAPAQPGDARSLRRGPAPFLADAKTPPAPGLTKVGAGTLILSGSLPAVGLVTGPGAAPTTDVPPALIASRGVNSAPTQPNSTVTLAPSSPTPNDAYPMTGTGTLTLTGNNTFTGGTIVSGGVLAVTPSALPSSVPGQSGSMSSDNLNGGAPTITSTPLVDASPKSAPTPGLDLTKPAPTTEKTTNYANIGIYGAGFGPQAPEFHSTAAASTATRATPSPTPGPKHAKTAQDVRRLLAEEQRKGNLGDQDAIKAYQDVLHDDEYHTSARRSPGQVAKKKEKDSDAARDHPRSQMLNEVNSGWKEPESTLSHDKVKQEIAVNSPQGTATYRPIIENPFTFVAQQPLSTFSTDVDTASYANVRRFLNAGQRPPADAVRLEELINYFPYQYEPPQDGKPLAVHVDVTEAPWQPLHRLVRIALKGREVPAEQRPAANFTFLLDVSGSMEPAERLPLVKKSLRLLVEQLREDDHVAIVTYAGESGVALESTPGNQKEKILEAIDALRAGGSTNGAGGIRLAYEQAQANFIENGVNRVILSTDGDFNVGTSSVEDLEKLIAEKAKSGVFLSVLGVGTDNLHDHTMQVLADRGNGNYHYLDSLGEARKVLVEQMTGTLVTIAKDVKIQVEFNPSQVAAYRLIGYEKRLLAKEDFNDDKKDAGDMGAGHTVTALYEVVPASLKYPDGKPLVDDLKYQKPASETAAAAKPDAPANTELMTVKLRYKEPTEDKSKLLEVPVPDAMKKLSESDRDFQFAVSLAGFGMLLRGSPYSNDLNWDNVRKLALSGKGADEQGWRGEFIQLIEKARALCEETR